MNMPQNPTRQVHALFGNANAIQSFILRTNIS